MNHVMNDEQYLEYVNLDKEIKLLSHQKNHLKADLFKKNICAECQKKYSKKEITIKPMGTNRLVYQCPNKHLIMVLK